MTELSTNDDEMVIIMVMMVILIIMMKNYQYHEFPLIWMYFLSSELDSH